MKKYIIFSDCHLNSGSFEWPGDFEFGENVVMLGDNHEMKNQRKKNKKKSLLEYEKFLKKCKETGTHVLAGNHEISVGRDMLGVYNIMIDDDLFTHGNLIAYSDKKNEKWFSRHFGTGFWNLMGIRSKNGNYKPSKNKTAPMSLRKKLADYAKGYQAKSITVGHFHYVWQGMHDGVNINIVGRGRSEIKI